jgi:3-mercaptopyruvate sulfurtransferase SseA
VRVQRITKEQLKERFDRGDVPTLLDVRLKYPYEHSTVRLPGALRAAPNAVGSLSIPRDKEIVVYDSDPGEIVSARVAHSLLRKGYQVSVLKGGLPDWVTANYPTETKEAPRAAPPEPKSPKG